MLSRQIRTIFLLVLSLGAVECFTLSNSNKLYKHRNQARSLSPISSRQLSNEFKYKFQLDMAQVDQKEAQSGIDKVVKALRTNSAAVKELGKLVKVTNVLGFGSPKAGTLAVRFNAQFQKGGMGRSSIPLPFGLGQSDVSEGRGTMVGQVKASLDSKSGKILTCSVFRDLGYGRAFNLKV